MKKIIKHLVCVDCQKQFRFIGRTKALRCVSCRRKYASKYQMLWRQARNPSIRIGVGSGGHQWRENNHMWKGGKRPKYVGNYRSRCFKYWQRRCVICGSTHKIHVHHADGDTTNLHIWNLIPVCTKHHKQLHRSKGTLTKLARLTLLFKLWPKGRSKIAELSGNPEMGIRTEGCHAYAGQSGATTRGEETIIPHEAATL